MAKQGTGRRELGMWRAVVYSCHIHAWEGRQHFYQGLAQEFAKSYPVLYVSSPIRWPPAGDRVRGARIRGGYLTSPSPNLFVFRPLVPRGLRFLPWRVRAELYARAAISAMQTLGLPSEGLLLWCYSPEDIGLVRALRKAISIYWTGDEVTHPGEPKLLEAVDVIFAISPPAVEQKRALARGKPVVRMPIAIDPEPFIVARVSSLVPSELRAIARPIIGYGGSLTGRVDFDIIRHLAQCRLGSVVLVGPVLDAMARDALRRLEPHPNIIWVGHRNAEDAPRYIAAFDVGIIPYTRSSFNLGCNPVKFYEYLAAGLPVVSTEIPALREFGGFVHFADGPAQFGEAVHAAIAEGPRPEKIFCRQEVARAYSYGALVRRIHEVLAELRCRPGWTAP